MKERKIPMRKCVGCNTSKPKEELIRIAFYEGDLTLDYTGRAKGRGIYVCKDSNECTNNAEKRRAIERNFPEATKEQIKKLFQELRNGDGK